jgi:formylglycine-generating enzyme required for sulfatase activity
MRVTSAHLTPSQVGSICSAIPRSDILSADAVATFVQTVKDFRLPSEAELEYAGREGGAVSFLHDGGRVWSKTRQFPHESAWGFAEMTFAAWAADEWHDDYEAAPEAAVSWTNGSGPSVYRGCLLDPPATEEELLFALAACRGRMINEDEDEWPIGLRVARSVSL